ncbi:MAG TPA: DinB family protein [Dehalococcoidia bacterium]|nr:DinB family protein [Dehalococcoidia bacterium]
MAEDRDGLLRHYAGTRDDLLAAIAGLGDADLTERSLDGWSVADHLAHIALWDDIRTSEVARISAGHASAWRMTEAQVTAYNAIGHDLRQHLSPVQALWELAASRAALLEAIAAASPRGLDAALYTEAALRSTHEAQHTAWIRRWRAERRP